MNIYNAIWWFIFFTTAILCQAHFEGLDFLIIGFIILVQEEKLKQFLWVAPFILLIQESLSTFTFGSILLWYTSAVAFLYLGRWLFEIENFLFMFLFSSCLALTHVLIFSLMARLQKISFDMTTLLDTSVIQALLIPIIWQFAILTRLKAKH